MELNETDPLLLVKLKEQYRRLKEEHNRLQHEYGNLEIEYKQVLDNLSSTQSNFAKDLETLQNKNKELEKEIFLLRPKILTAEAEELIKLRATEDIERKFAAEVNRHTSQAENILLEKNELRRENDFLKAELANLNENVERLKIDYRQRLDAETTALQRQRESLFAEERNRSNETSKRANKLELDNKQCSLKVDSLQKEIEELTFRLQKCQSEHQTNLRDLNKKLGNANSQLSALIAERDCCRQQSDMLSREISSLSESNVRVTSRVHDLERHNGLLQSRIDELSHNHAMELNNAKLQYLNDKSSCERERSDMRLLLKECESERDNIRQLMDQKTNMLLDKEKECQQKISLAAEESLKIKTELQDEISTLTSKLSESERKCRNLEDKLESCKENKKDVEDRLLKEKDGLSLEIIALKEQLARNQGNFSFQSVDVTPKSAPVGDPHNIAKWKNKLKSLKRRLSDEEKLNSEIQAALTEEKSARKRTEEKNNKLRSWIENFCRGHSHFQKVLDSCDWNNERLIQ